MNLRGTFTTSQRYFVIWGWQEAVPAINWMSLAVLPAQNVSLSPLGGPGALCIVRRLWRMQLTCCLVQAVCSFVLVSDYCMCGVQGAGTPLHVCTSLWTYAVMLSTGLVPECLMHLCRGWLPGGLL